MNTNEDEKVMYKDEGFITELHRQIKLLEGVISNLRLICHVIETEISGEKLTDETGNEVEVSRPDEQSDIELTMTKARFAVRMADVLSNHVSNLDKLKTILQIEGFKTLNDVTPDRFEEIISLMEKEGVKNEWL